MIHFGKVEVSLLAKCLRYMHYTQALLMLAYAGPQIRCSCCHAGSPLAMRRL